MRLTLITLLMSFALNANAAEVTKEKIESQGKQRSYYLFVPDLAKVDTKPALVVLLHGSGRNGLSLVDKWKDLASKEGFIIAGPDSLSGGSWKTPEDGPEFIHDLVEVLVKKFNIDTQRLYLFGHSAGAVFGLGLAMFESEYFAAVAVHAGSWRSREEFGFIDLAKRKIPLKIIVGDRDSFFPLESVKATEKALKDRQFEIEVAVMSGHGHWYYDLAPQINQNAWEFLKKNVLNGERRHVHYNFGAAEANASAALKQINVLRLEAEKLNTQIDASENEINSRDRVKDKGSIAELVHAQIDVLSECAKLLRDAANLAERSSKMKVAARYQQVFELIASACLKRAEALDFVRARSELLLTDEEVNSVNSKRTALVNKANILNDEALELEKKAASLLQ